MMVVEMRVPKRAGQSASCLACSAAQTGSQNTFCAFQQSQSPKNNSFIPFGPASEHSFGIIEIFIPCGVSLF